MAARVPEHIKDKMQKVVNYANLSHQYMGKVEAWLEKNGIDPSYEGGLRDGSGNGLEELEYGVNVIDALCERIEQILREGAENG